MDRQINLSDEDFKALLLKIDMNIKDFKAQQQAMLDTLNTTVNNLIAIYVKIIEKSD